VSNIYKKTAIVVASARLKHKGVAKKDATVVIETTQKPGSKKTCGHSHLH
jgi:hypothetical protein